MKKLLALVLVMMLCLPAFASAAPAARAKADKIVAQINDILALLEEGDARMQYTTVGSEKEDAIIFDSNKYISSCQLCYTDDGSGVEGVYLLAMEKEPNLMNCTVIYGLAMIYYDAGDDLSTWLTETYVEILGLLDQGEGLVRRSYQLDGAEVCVLGMREDYGDAFFFELLAEDAIPVT